MKSKKMKIGLCAVFAFVLTSTLLVGCSSGSGSNSGGSNGNSQAQSSTKSNAKYAVSIDSCTVTKDYNGAPAIIVSYTFTNNSDKDQSFMVAISDKCFQNGVQLSTAIVPSGIDSQSSMNQVKPGASIAVQSAYRLNDQSEVKVECTELMSLDKTMLAEKSFSVA